MPRFLSLSFLAFCAALSLPAIASANPLTGVGEVRFATVLDIATVDTSTCARDPRQDFTKYERCALFPASNARGVAIVRAAGAATCGPTVNYGADSMTATVPYFDDDDGGLGGYQFTAAGERYDMSFSWPLLQTVRPLLASPHGFVGLCSEAINTANWSLRAPCSSNDDCHGSATCENSTTVSRSVWSQYKKQAGLFLVCRTHAAANTVYVTTENVPQ